MIKWVASIEPCDEAMARSLQAAWRVRGRGAQAKNVGIVIGAGVRLGIDDDNLLLALSALKSIMTCVNESAVDRGATLTEFSAVAIAVGEIGARLDEWSTTGAAPVLSIFAFELGENRHVAGGVEAFARHALSAEFAEPARWRD
jgi:hypothetical protein